MATLVTKSLTVRRKRQRCVVLRTFLVLSSAKACGKHAQRCGCAPWLNVHDEQVKYEFTPASTEYFWFITEET